MSPVKRAILPLCILALVAGVAMVVIDYTLTYQFAGKTYVATASTARARDR